MTAPDQRLEQLDRREAELKAERAALQYCDDFAYQGAQMRRVDALLLDVHSRRAAIQAEQERGIYLPLTQDAAA